MEGEGVRHMYIFPFHSFPLIFHLYFSLFSFRLHNELGNGSFGVVKKGEWIVSSQPTQTLPVAVKVLKADAFSQPGIYDDFRREVEAMHSLNHPNLIKLHGVVFHPLMMVCELAPMGALLDYIRAQNGKVSLNFIYKWSSQVAAGMSHLEKNRFLHRDLACRNILLSTLELVSFVFFYLISKQISKRFT